MAEEYVLLINKDNWMSSSKGIPFLQTARAYGYKVIRVAPGNRFADQEDVFILDPLSNPEVTKAKLKKYAGKIDFVFPAADTASSFIASAAPELGIAFNSAELAEKISYKLGLASFLRDHRLETPRTWLIQQEMDFLSIPDHTPLMIKPNLSTGATKRHSWDYKGFSNRNELIQYLKENELLEAFFVNSSLEEKKQSIVQERVTECSYLDVHVAFRKKGEFQTFLIGEFNVNEEDFLIVESKSANDSTEELKNQIYHHISLFSEMGFQNSVANFQFAVRDKKTFLFDVNMRVAGIWSYLYKIMMPDFHEKLISYFQGQNVSFELKHPVYLKTPYWLSQGKKIRQIELPKIESDRILTAYMDHLRPGYSVPLKQNSIQPAPQIFSVGENAETCRDQINQVIQRTKVSYY